MEIVKRECRCAICTATLWWIPSLTYIIFKMNGIKFHNEWIWWVAIPIMVLIWGLLNWKIKK